MRTLIALFVLSAALAFSAPGRADESQNEKATFRIQVRGKTVGTETMTVESLGDSLAIHTQTIQLLGPNGADSLIKRAGFGVDAYDLNLRSYASVQKFRGHVVSQSLMLHDTLFTSYRDRDGRGAGDTFTRPPGHLFVVDAGVFASFDLVCRMLRGRAFERRTVALFVVAGESDTLVEAPLVDLGTEPVKFGEKNVSARRFTLGEEPGAYRIWMDSEGRMMRLEHEPSGLRVDRVGQAVKKRPVPTPH